MLCRFVLCRLVLVVWVSRGLGLGCMGQHGELVEHDRHHGELEQHGEGQRGGQEHGELRE